MINVQINEANCGLKPFPKLMTGNVGANTGWIVEVHQVDTPFGKYIAIHRAGPYAGELVINFDPKNFRDYNGSITIKNA